MTELTPMLASQMLDRFGPPRRLVPVEGLGSLAKPNRSAWQQKYDEEDRALTLAKRVARGRIAYVAKTMEIPEQDLRAALRVLLMPRWWKRGAR